MPVDFLLNPSASQDPHIYQIFARNATGFVAESNPGADACVCGGQDKGSAIIRIVFGSVTSITYQVLFFIEKATAYVPGPTFTKTPTDQGEKIDMAGTPFGIKVLAMAGSGNASFYVSVLNRDTGGN